MVAVSPPGAGRLARRRRLRPSLPARLRFAR